LLNPGYTGLGAPQQPGIFGKSAPSNFITLALRPYFSITLRTL
jgi:hypothetical protein